MAAADVAKRLHDIGAKDRSAGRTEPALFAAVNNLELDMLSKEYPFGWQVVSAMAAAAIVVFFVALNVRFLLVGAK